MAIRPQKTTPATMYRTIKPAEAVWGVPPPPLLPDSAAAAAAARAASRTAAVVGALVGAGTGAGVGFGVGAKTGAAVGAGIGFDEGAIDMVGFGVGAGTGASDGAGVGLAVGAALTSPPAASKGTDAGPLISPRPPVENSTAVPAPDSASVYAPSARQNWTASSAPLESVPVSTVELSEEMV